MKMNGNIRKFVNAAMLAALTCVAVLIIEIPIPATNGYINAGDGIVLLCAALLIGGMVSTGDITFGNRKIGSQVISLVLIIS